MILVALLMLPAGAALPGAEGGADPMLDVKLKVVHPGIDLARG